MLPFPVSLGGRDAKKRYRASAPSGARARPGPRAAVMVTASARRLGCGPPGPGPPGPPRLGLSRCPSPSDSGFVLDSFRFKLLKYYSTVTVTGTRAPTRTRTRSRESLAGLAVNLKFILGRRAALAFAVGQPWFVWGLPVFSNVQYGGCMGEKNTYGTIPPW